MGDNDIVRTSRDDVINVKKKHNGIPYINFGKLFFLPFKDLISQKTDDGYTFLSVMNGTDMCGANFVQPAPAVPAGAAPGAVAVAWAATPEQIRKHNLRVIRLHRLLLSCIDDRCDLFRTLNSAVWTGQGVLACAYVQTSQELPMDPIAMAKLDAGWLTLKWNSEGVSRHSKQTLFAWKELVLNYADRFPLANIKTLNECWSRFILGCPVEIQTHAQQQQVNPQVRYNIAANHPVGHPLAGQPNPDAGQRNLALLATDLSIIWLSLIDNGTVKVKNYASGDESAHFTSSRRPGRGGRGGKQTASGRGLKGKKGEIREIDSKSMCYKCGGLGHMARVRKNGTLVENCPTTVDIDPDTILGIKYPHMENPKLKNKKDKEAANLADDDGSEVASEGSQTNGSDDDVEEVDEQHFICDDEDSRMADAMSHMG